MQNFSLISLKLCLQGQKNIGWEYNTVIFKFISLLYTPFPLLVSLQNNSKLKFLKLNVLPQYLIPKHVSKLLD